MSGPSPQLIDTPAGIRIATYSWGGAGQPVLLSHPTGFHGRIWAPVASALVAAGRCVYSFDFRGHGDSDPSNDGYIWRNFAADVTAVADHFDIAGRDDLIAAGHSKGAASLLLAELEQPGTFHNIWAYEPIMFPQGTSPFPPGSDPLANGARRRRNEWASIDEVFTAYSSKPPLNVMTTESLRAYVDHGLRDRGDGVWVLKCDPENEAATYEGGAANGIFERLHEIKSTVCIAVGETTDAITPKFAALIQLQLPHATLDVWQGRGHFGPQEDPQRCAAEITMRL